MFEDIAQRLGYALTPATRRLLNRVRQEAAIPGHRLENGAYMAACARVAGMSEAELRERGCPAGEVGALLRFATAEAVESWSLGGYPDSHTQLADFILEIAALRWGSLEADDALYRWLKAGQERSRRRYGCG